MKVKKKILFIIFFSQKCSYCHIEMKYSENKNHKVANKCLTKSFTYMDGTVFTLLRYLNYRSHSAQPLIRLYQSEFDWQFKCLRIPTTIKRIGV